MAGSVAALVSSYDTALQVMLRSVTGDPAALRAAAARCDRWSGQLDSYHRDVTQLARELGADWDGSAYQACNGSLSRSAVQAGQASSTLGYARDRLASQALALEDAAGTQTKINNWFDSNGRMYVSLAQASGADEAAIAARVQEVGEQALDMSEQNKAQLGRRLAGPESEGATLFDYSRTYSAGIGDFANGLSYGADAQARIGPHLTGSLTAGTGQDGKILDGTVVQGELAAQLVNGQANAYLTDGSRDLRASTALTIGADGKLAVGGKDGFGVEVGAAAKASASVSSTDHYGGLAVTDKTEATAELSAHAQLGKGEDGSYGVSAGAGATAGITRTESASVGGLQLSVNGGVTTGAGAEAGLAGGYDHGHLTLNANLGVTDVVGLRGGVGLDVDVPKVAGELSSGATYVWHGAEHAASSVGQAVGAAWEALAGN